MRKADLLLKRAQVRSQRLRHDDRLLVDFLEHEVAVIALFNQRRRHAGNRDLAGHRIIVDIENLRALAREHDPIAFLEIGNPLGQRRERECIGAEKGFAIAIADHKGGAESRADEQVGILAEGDCQRKGAAQARQDQLYRILGRQPRLDVLADQMGHDFGIGLAFELPPTRLQLFAQRFEVFDDTVVHQRGMRMRVDRVGHAVRRPARVCDACVARRGIGRKNAREIDQLALRTAADQLGMLDGAQACGIIAAILHPLQAIDQAIGDRFLPDDSDNATHLYLSPQQAPWIGVTSSLPPSSCGTPWPSQALLPACHARPPAHPARRRP